MKRTIYFWIAALLLLLGNTSYGQLTINSNAGICAPATQVRFWLTGNNSGSGYTWTVPSGATITSGQGYTAIYVDFSQSAHTGLIQVSGNGQNASYLAEVHHPPSSLGVINGKSPVCAGQKGVSYSVSGGTPGYAWVAMGGASITTTTNSPTILVDFPTNYTGGDIIAYGTDGPCGTGPTTTLHVNVGAIVPSKPGTISSSSSTAITPGQTGVTYSISAVANATSYGWTLPTGASFASGTNTTSNSITVNFSSSFTGGTISVYGSNGTCSGDANSLALTLSTACGQPVINGAGAICTGATGNSATYTVSIPNATNYYWSFNGGIYPSTNTTNATTVTVTFPSSLSSSSNCSISVYGSNSYGNGPTLTYPISVYKPAGVVGLIRGPKFVTPGQTGATYTIQAVDNVTSYIWNLPSGVSGSSSTSTSRTLTFPANFVNGIITVTPLNGACSSGLPSSFTVISSPNGQKVEDQTDKNYVMTRSVLKDNIYSGTDVEALSVDAIQESVTYYDGLGRPIQTVNTAGSPNFRDIIQPMAYDQYGRETTKYLPYVDLDGGGLYRTNALNDVYTSSDHFKFYTNGYGNAPDVAADLMNVGQYAYNAALTADRNIEVPQSVTLQPGFSTNGHALSIKIVSVLDPSQVAIKERITPFSVSILEPSPLNRVLEQGAPGYDWQPTDQSGSSTGHTVKATFTVNAASEVPLWTVDNSTGALTLASTNAGYYEAGTLFISTTKNENWALGDGNKNTTVEYKDKAGRVVLKKSFLSDTEAASTLYAYDDMGRLRYVMPPEAVRNIGTTSILQFTDDFVKKWCFYYEYDEMQRITLKLVPGADQVYMIYDGLNRLVLVQDGERRKGSNWLYTKYDVLNRPVITGLVSITNKDFGALQTAFASYTGSYFESATNTGNVGYTLANSFSTIFSTPETSVLTATYYDNYNFAPVTGFSALAFDAAQAYNQVKLDYLAGKVTGTRIKVLNGNELTASAIWLNSISYYDVYYRSIQNKRDLYDGSSAGKEMASTLYDFAGKAMQSKVSQTFGTTSVYTEKSFTYDAGGRLLKVQQTINNGYSATISESIYNELGQLSSKKIGNVMQQLDYTYNVRGWLKQLNDPASMGSDLFAMKLLYNDNSAILGLTSAQQYNGNISGMIITRRNDANSNTNTTYGLGYSYDCLRRLNASNYGEASGFAIARDKYSEYGITYDYNGNIKTLQRNNSTGLIDNLTYGYKNNGSNQLLNVTDATAKPAGFSDVSGDDYDYDANGNLVKDNNKGLSSISYNLLNLPYVLSKDANNKIRYVYDATGTKLSKEATITGTNSTRYYCNGFEYDNTKALSMFHTDEGLVAITYSGGTQVFNYQYFLKDHLGNNRVLFNSGGTLMQRTDYYPFGLTADQYNSSTDNNYLYNGKELQKELGLGWLDFRYRFYDPQIGRFHSIDRLADKYSYKTPYDYAENRVIEGFDLDGLECATGIMAGAPPSPGVAYLSKGGKDEALAMKIDMSYNKGGLIGGIGALTLPFLAGEAALWSGVSWMSLPAISSYTTTAASATFGSRLLGFTADAGGQWVANSISSNSITKGFSSINWSVPALNFINPGSSLLNGIVGNSLQVSTGKGFQIGTPSQIITGSLTEWAGNAVGGKMMDSWYGSNFYRNELNKIYSFNSIGTDAALNAASRQASMLAGTTFGLGLLSESAENITGNYLQNTPFFMGFDNMINQINSVLQNTASMIKTLPDE